MALAIGYYLIDALRKIALVVAQVNGIIAENRDSLEATVEVLPELLSNSNEVVLGVRQTIDSANSAVTTIEDNLADTADKVQETVETALLYARCAGEVARAVVGAFSKNTDK
jgi:methyl-accepting chemotaxis protein